MAVSDSSPGLRTAVAPNTWTGMFSRRAVSLFDYVMTDSVTWTGNRSKRTRLWIPGEVGMIADVQEFMDTLVDHTVGILNSEPVDIYVNPTFLPDVIAGDHESLWTETGRRKVIGATVKNGVAIELNDRYRLKLRGRTKRYLWFRHCRPTCLPG